MITANNVTRKLTIVSHYSLEGLTTLHQTKQQMFRNLVLTDGYTCVVNFSRARRPADVDLELQDFNAEEIGRHFRPCAIDPGRTDAFTAEYPDGQSRSLGTHEYYSMTGSLARSRQLNIRKREHNVQETETNIPTPKVTTLAAFNVHVAYVLRHLHTLFILLWSKLCDCTLESILRQAKGHRRSSEYCD